MNPLHDQLSQDISIWLSGESILEEADRAADALRSVSSGEPLVEELRVSAPVSGGSTILVDAIRALDLQGVEVTDLQLRRPTLDDVFMSLTGHAAEDEVAQAPKKGRRRGKRGGEAA